MNFLIVNNLLDPITDLSEKILKLFVDFGIIKLSDLKNESIYGSIIDVQKSMFIEFFGLHIIDYLC